jgi:hypothetical protein
VVVLICSHEHITLDLELEVQDALVSHKILLTAANDFLAWDGRIPTTKLPSPPTRGDRLDGFYSV